MKRFVLLTFLMSSLSVLAADSSYLGFTAPAIDGGVSHGNITYPQAGDIYLNTNSTTNGFFGYDGTTWNSLAGGGASADTVKTPGQSAPVVVSAKITDGSGVGVVTEDDSDFINGDCSNPGDAGNYTCTFNTSYFTGNVHCWVEINTSSSLSTRVTMSSGSAMVVFYGPSTAEDAGFYLFCKGPRS